MDAIDAEKYKGMGDFELVDALSELSGVKVPQAIEEIRTAPVLHKNVVETEDMPKIVKQFLNIGDAGSEAIKHEVMAGHLWNITSYFKTKAGEGTLFFHVPSPVFAYPGSCGF